MDELTGLRNRRAMREDFLDWSSSSGALCVVLMDLNGLKEINDTLGHQVGDTLIVGAAQCFSDTLGHYGTVYRTGGDEFVAVVEDVSEEEFQSQVDRLHFRVYSMNLRNGQLCGAISR